MITLLLGACSKKAQVEETPPIQLLLIQAQSLSRLELASTRIKITLRIDPHRDGFLGFKKLFGSKVTRVELQSQASVFCDLALLTEGMITQRADSTIDLRLPPLEIKRELDDLHHTVIQEPTGLRRRLSTNELDEFIASKQADSISRKRSSVIGPNSSARLTRRLRRSFSRSSKIFASPYTCI